MKLSSWLLAACIFTAGLTHAATDVGPVQTEINQISADLASIESNDGITRYQRYKAKLWLAYAQNEYAERSLSTAGQEALQQAQTINAALKSGQQLSLNTHILSVSQVMRRDLWQQIELFKQQGALDTAPEHLAHAEVMLVWAAAEYCEMGWRHANEHFRAAEQALQQVSEHSNIRLAEMDRKHTWPTLAELNGQGCHGVNEAYWPMSKKTEIILPQVVHNVVHFASNSAVLSSASQQVLIRLAAALEQQPLVELSVLGYTDRRATEAFNLKLAQTRIDTVQQFLIQHGIPAQRIKSVAKGAQAFETDADEKMAQAKSRRVVIELSDDTQLQVQPQWQDLQVNSDAQKVKVN